MSSTTRIGQRNTLPLAEQHYSVQKPLPAAIRVAHIAVGALFVGSAAGAVVLALLPMGPLVPGTSLTVPLMVCVGLGGTSLIYLTISLVVSRKRVSKRIRACLRENTIFQGEGVYQAISDHRESTPIPENKRFYRDSITLTGTTTCCVYKRQVVNIPTRDGLLLSGVWVKSKQPHAKTMILFPYNTSGQTGMREWTGWYSISGFNVLVVVPRGYGLSEGSSREDGELGTLLDAEAGLNWLVNNQNIDPKTVIAHGSCTGGALAAALGVYYNIQAVVFDHSFASFKDVTQSFVQLPPLAHVVSRVTFSKGQTLRGDLSLPDKWIKPNKEFVTDGLNSAKKVSEMKCPTYVIQGNWDWITPKRHGRALTKSTAYIIPVEGGHKFNTLFGNKHAEKKLLGFLAPKIDKESDEED